MKHKALGLLLAALVALVLTGCPKPIDPLPDDMTITLLAIPGIVAPVKGATPVTTAIDSEQYTGTVAWNPADNPFAANTVYTATINLTPKPGYTLAGVAANSFTVAGATATNSADSGVVTAVFPETVSDNANLATLTVSSGTLSPTFSPDVTEYYFTVQNSVGNITLTGTAADAGATISANNGVAQPLNVGANTVTITVTAEDGVAAKAYTITVHRYSLANFDMVVVPPGSFQRDATATNISVITQAYRMSQHEITRAQFLAVIGTDPSNTTYSSGTSDPVQTTNWYHAIAFCNKLSLAEGLTPVYAVSGVNFSTLTYASIPTTDNADWNAATATWTNDGYRLPTEMEWMWAAMGAPANGQNGGTNTTGYAKAFAGSTGSNAIGDYAVFGYNGSETGRTTTERTNPVGSKTANELGLYDMSGNV